MRAETILIATGAWPYHGAQIAGLEHVISSNEAFHLTQLPKRIVIQGGGYIAVEFAGIFAGLGSQVTLVYRGENILRGFDDDVREHLRSEMQRRGIKIITRQTVAAIEKVDHGYDVELSDNEQIVVDLVMFAIGRKPNVHGLGLEAAGVKLGENGGIAVDALFADVGPKTSMRSATSPTGSISRRWRSARAMPSPTRSMAASRPRSITAMCRPRCSPSPSSASIGLTEAQARERLAKVDVYKTSFRPMKATLSGRDTRIFMKLVVDGITDRVVGCHIVGPDAGELIQLVGVAVKMGATKADFDATMAVHPTAAEELVTMREKAASYSQAAAE